MLISSLSLRDVRPGLNPLQNKDSHASVVNCQTKRCFNYTYNCNKLPNIYYYILQMELFILHRLLHITELCACVINKK